MPLFGLSGAVRLDRVPWALFPVGYRRSGPGLLADIAAAEHAGPQGFPIWNGLPIASAFLLTCISHCDNINTRRLSVR